MYYVLHSSPLCTTYFSPINIQLVYRIPVILAHKFTSRVDPDQLASQKPADLDLHCFQNRIYPGRYSLYNIILYNKQQFFFKG